MRWNNVYLAGLGVDLPERVLTAEQAVRDGLYDARRAKINGIRAVRIAPDDEPPPMMAVRAGRRALARSGHRAEQVGLLLHTYINHQGRDMWSPAQYVQQGTVGSSCQVAMEVRQGCNGALGALELAASHLSARPDVDAALITAADAWKQPYVDRFTTDEQVVFSDGGSAALLSSRSGFARLLSTASRSEPSLEPMYRGEGPWTTAPFLDGKPLAVSERPRQWLMREENVYDDTLGLMDRRFAEAIAQALADADTELADVRWFVHANVIRPIAEWGFVRKIGFDPARTPYEWGLGVGHLGNSDQFAGVDHLIEAGLPRAGDRLVMVGIGTGFMWTAAVLELLEVPRW
ncbi:ketoacyl-ACP synthase III family protein [Allokutzneria sp. A3M-2-11 16]|uniref:ketoacyl-ACP synthase III family protein n=1 Tax=Allokutzneria sp. A3M-2-11 16 TaxID=2962043 RepID=UPI0020B6A04B|nr:ketoacyl-ACP synthase III family protein [Allokutzneria sp. A3M-2-11 16]MCP3803368.1 ketoacyl-ACP synthase III family protein [Allokutzneria sp. A3M-2-11 16]